MLNFQMELNELKTGEDFQRLVDAINAILCMDTDIEASVVTSTHSKYDQAVRMVNDRLKQCDHLLQKGLRAEALQQANIEPKLLDVVAILDFDEQELWNSYAQRCGFARVPELLVDFADDLQTAWADEEPLTDLKYRHRLHALARSPLAIRIDILRQLAKADQSNPLWEEELQIYEKARLADVLEECKAAAQSDDLERILALEAELKNGGWRVPPPAKLIGFASARSKEVQGKKARAQLVQLEPLLNEAYSLSDVETARNLRGQWGRHAAVAELSEKDPLMLKVLEPLKWLAEKDRQDREQAAYQAAVRELEQALDRRDAGKADFEPLYYKIEQFGQGLPEGLQERLALRVDELDRQAARGRRIKLISISSAAVLLLVLAGMGIFAYGRHAEVSAHIAVLEGLIAAGQLDQAEAYVSERESDNPRVHDHPRFQAVVRELEQSVQADEDRRSRLDRLFAEAESTIESLDPGDPASLDPSKINKGYEALRLAYFGKPGEEGAGIAQTEMEQAKVKALRDQLDAKVIEVQKATDDVYRADVAKFQEELKALDPDGSGYTGKLNAQRQKGLVLRDRRWISPDLGPQLITPLLAQVDALIEQDQTARAEEASLEEILAAVGDANLYRLKLSDYVNDRRFAGSPRRRQFEQLLENETALWVGFEDWSRLKGELQTTNLAKYSPKYAPDLIAKAEAVLQKHKGFPKEAEIQKAVDYLNVLVLRSQGQLQLSVEKALNQQIFSRLFLLEVKTGEQQGDGEPVVKRYYCTKLPIGLGETHLSIRYAMDTTLDDEQPLTVPIKDVLNPKKSDGRGYDFESPQNKFSALAKEKMVELTTDPTTWEKDFLEILGELHNNKTMDDFVRFLLIDTIITVACDGSPYLKEKLQNNLDTLAKFRGEINPKANWINPEIAAGDDARRSAQGLLKRLTDPSEAERGLQDYLDSLKQVELGPDYEWVGWLHRGRKNQWVITYAEPPAIKDAPAALHVLIRDAGGRVHFQQVGELRSGQEMVTAPDGSPTLLEGRPVFEQK